jgi:hypothetical protein
MKYITHFLLCFLGVRRLELTLFYADEYKEFTLYIMAYSRYFSVASSSRQLVKFGQHQVKVVSTQYSVFAATSKPFLNLYCLLTSGLPEQIHEVKYD